jgi:hypothetical protein
MHSVRQQNETPLRFALVCGYCDPHWHEHLGIQRDFIGTTCDRILWTYCFRAPCCRSGLGVFYWSILDISAWSVSRLLPNAGNQYQFSWTASSVVLLLGLDPISRTGYWIRFFSEPRIAPSCLDDSHCSFACEYRRLPDDDLKPKTHPMKKPNV